LELFALLFGNLFFLPGAHLLDLGDVELQQVVDPRQEVLPKAVLATSSSSLHNPSDTVAAKNTYLDSPMAKNNADDDQATHSEDDRVQRPREKNPHN
jgi:hypothetical protein